MAAESFREFYRRVLEHEGKVCEDVPGDNGGPTKWGITIFDYAEAVGKKVPMLDKRRIDRKSPAFAKLRDELYAASEEWIENRYRSKYWDSIRADELPRGIDYVVADLGVNAGEAQAVKFLQRICGTPDSGRMDDDTLDHVRQIPAADVINHFHEMRVAFYESIIRRNPSQMKFRRGWMNRANDVRQTALTWAAKDFVQVAPKMARATLVDDVAEDDTPAAPAPVMPAKPVRKAKVVAQSRSNWWLIGAAGAWVEKQFGFVTGMLPDAQQSVEDVVDPLTSLGGLLKINMSSIIATVTIIALAVVIVRHSRDRIELAKARGE